MEGKAGTSGMYSSPLCNNVWVCMYGYVRTLAREIKMGWSSTEEAAPVVVGCSTPRCSGNRIR